MEFRIPRATRDRYAIDDAMFSIRGEALVIDSSGAARLAERLAPDDATARRRIAADLSALGLLHELGHRAVAQERATSGTAGGPVRQALAHAEERLGTAPVADTLAAFETSFPTTLVYGGERSALDEVAGDGREAALEELLLAWLARTNPAVAPYLEFVDDPVLTSPAITALLGGLGGGDEPSVSALAPMAPARELMARLAEPMTVAPTSLAGQLR